MQGRLYPSLSLEGLATEEVLQSEMKKSPGSHEGTTMAEREHPVTTGPQNSRLSETNSSSGSELSDSWSLDESCSSPRAAGRFSRQLQRRRHQQLRRQHWEAERLQREAARNSTGQ